MALVVSGISMYQSVRANRAVVVANKLAEKNIKISEEALSLAKGVEDSKGELSLKAEVSSTFPQTLTFSSLSNEVAIASSVIGYLADGGFFYYGDATGTIKPGVHDLTPISLAIDGELTARVKAAETHGRKAEKHGWGTFPFLLTVEYVFRGRSRTTSFVYEVDVRYFPELAELLLSREKRAAMEEGYLPLGDVHLVRELDDDEDGARAPPELLSELYERWRKQIGFAELDDKWN